MSSIFHDADDLGDEFGALHASTLQQARDKVAMVGMRKQARSDLKQIIDGEALRHGLQLATKSQMWDPSRGPNSAVSAVDVASAWSSRCCLRRHAACRARTRARPRRSRRSR